MNEPNAGAVRAARAAEQLSLARFGEEVRRAAPIRPGLPLADPLDAAVKKIEKDPAFTQSRLLTRVLAALIAQEGEFRRAEIAAFDSETLTMVIALMDVYAAGTATREEWVCAAELAQAAQSGIGG